MALVHSHAYRHQFERSDAEDGKKCFHSLITLHPCDLLSLYTPA